MATLQIKKAIKFGAKAKIAIYGPSGSGKTYTSLMIALEMAGDKRVLLIDSEDGSASKYADLFDFDVIDLDAHDPQSYINAIALAAKSQEHSVIILDSITQEWDGVNGALEQVGGNITKWSKVTPLHRKFVDTMLSTGKHLIATMRAKEDYDISETEDKNGYKKKTITKLGVKPIQREGIQYEFDVIGSLKMDSSMEIVKTRCSSLKDITFVPGQEMDFSSIMLAWLSGAEKPDMQVTREKLNEVYARGKKAQRFADTAEFAAYIREVLDLDEMLSPASLKDSQVKALESDIAEKESQLTAA